jgi:hypothetical protein
VRGGGGREGKKLSLPFSRSMLTVIRWFPSNRLELEVSSPKLCLGFESKNTIDMDNGTSDVPVVVVIVVVVVTMIFDSVQGAADMEEMEGAIVESVVKAVVVWEGVIC